MTAIENIKKNLGDAAAKLIQDGMVVGLGTGTTVHYFIQSLIERYQKGLKIQVIASSEESLHKARKGNLPILDSDTLLHVDITVDGADEIDGEKQMIKGGGGALVREKILASMSREMVVIVDETKVVSKLGKRKLPVEILPFAYSSTLHKIHKLGYKGVIRLKSNAKPVITDNGNYLVDIDLHSDTLVPKQTHEDLIHIPGVVDTGFFFHLAGRVMIGFFDGQIVIRP
ncbi:MAG: ribose 5-phosphate isomerase A [Chlamydiae bacterium]|jgi:ribose 5-phosphate isomerase A|nr:ribose 5-phosphate isomerase A [Chlamydiota bacterium]